MVARHAGDGFVGGDEPLVHELGGHAEGRRGSALAHAGLEHPQLALLDGELDVAQVAVVRLELVHDGAQLVIGLLVEALEVGERKRVADAGDDVLALGVDQVVAVDARMARGGVPGEAHARARCLAHVAEHHRADVDRGSEVVGDALATAVEARALRVPRAEHGFDGQVELLARILGEVFAGFVLDDLLELLDEVLEVVGRHVEVARVALVRLKLVEDVGELVAVDVLDRLAEHLNETAVGVPGETLVAGLRGQALDRFVVEADVEDRLHHSGHGELRAGTDRDEQGIVLVAEALAHLLLDVAQVGRHFDVERLGGLARSKVCATRIGGDREARRNRKAELDHFGQVGAFPAEQILHVAVTLSERVDVLRH